MDDDKKNTHQFSDAFKNFSGNNCRNCRGMRAVIDSFEFYTIHFLMTKKNFGTNFIKSRALFRVAQPMKKKIK